MLNVVHAGLFCTEKETVLPAESVAVGWNL